MQHSPSGSQSRRGHALISIIVPVFNEEDAIGPFLEHLAPHVPADEVDYEIVFINDGSSDSTLERLRQFQRHARHLRIVDLSRNFGKEAAMTAGLDHARGDAVIIMDVDLQEPPELIPQMISKWREGFDVVYGQRISRDSDSFLKRFAAGGFYRWFNRIADSKIPADVGDFRLMDRRVVDALRNLPESVRFMKGLFAWVGFRTAAITFERKQRHSGTTKFNYWRLWNFAIDGITSFSTLPLRLWTYFGLTIAALAFFYGAFIMVRTLVLGIDIPGYASLLTIVLFLGGVQLIGMGVIGEYLGRVYLETKGRPVYLVSGFYKAPEDVTDYREAHALGVKDRA